MTLTDWIIIGIVAAILGTAGIYIWRQKKKGVKCVGCPYAEECSKKHCNH